MIEIDGSLGEGGGQVLRSALSLSALTGASFHIRRIRANREKPGLMTQHLKAVDAAAAICKAEVEGAALHATDLTFRPGSVVSGRFKFDIGTAGSTLLVLQTILLPLSQAGAASSVTITGGTHVPKSPCFQYIDLQWLPYLHAAGIDARLSLQQAGFYPQGGGRVDAVIRPAQTIAPLTLSERGALRRIYGISAVANLPADIGNRQKRQALLRLQKLPGLGTAPDIQIKTLDLPSPGKGTFLLLLAEFECGRACYFGLGALGKPAERVADEAVDALLAFLETSAAIDEYLADQLLLPLALANGPSRLSTCRITQHQLTNAKVVQMFLPARIHIEGDFGSPGMIVIEPGPSSREA